MSLKCRIFQANFKERIVREEFITRNILLDNKNAQALKESIREYFLTTYELFERLFDGFINDDVFYNQPEPLRHPHIFYFGHTATFYINKLNIAKLIDKRINKKFESIFAIGVDEMSWDDLNPNNYEWPSVDEVREYREWAKELVLDFIDRCEPKTPITWDDPLWIIMMGIEHERIHLETSSVLIRQTDISLIKKNPLFEICREKSDNYPKNELLEVLGSEVKMGKEFSSNQYGWDNEYGRYSEQIDSFRASKYLVSNGEFREFVRDGGYKKLECWSEEGRAWLEYTKATSPIFWIDNGARYRAIFEEIDMPLNWPVDVNFLEAEAFCNWKSQKDGVPITLPSEAQWVRLRDFSKICDEPYWERAPGNINLEHFASSSPVDMFEFKDGFFDIIGNVWQWSKTPIDAFEGFKIHKAYDDFSTPTFDGRHNLIKGGSFISTGNEANFYSRYAFRRHFFQHAGFRYIEDSTSKDESFNSHANSFYENDREISKYCEFHYGDDSLGVPNFLKNCAEIALELCKKRGKALDIGCSVGRASFELAKEFERVDGVDFTARSIKVAYALQKSGEILYDSTIEGEICDKKMANLEDLGLDKSSKKISFWQGDASNLKPHLRDYDLILALNLIDRMYAPREFLKNIHTRVNKDGVLILASPYTWLEEFTQKSEWIGGFYRDGKPLRTMDGIREILSQNFTQIGESISVPFVIRESERKYQYSFSELSAWVRS